MKCLDLAEPTACPCLPAGDYVMARGMGIARSDAKNLPLASDS